ncbi:MAG: hypothetical protein KF900_03825 [Bacteroidetes bacterium]|nr:hypothetical protein [Bacteroidota bacterium]
MIEGLQLSIPRRMAILKTVLLVSLVISVFLTFNLWGGSRFFPCTPVFINNPVQAPYDYVFIILAVLLWVSALFLRIERLLLFLAFLLSVVLVLFDLNRLQTWFYVYNAMLLVFVFYNGRVDDANKFTSLFIVLQLISASVYFFCGLSQLNEHFIEHSFAEIISPLRNIMSERQFLFIKSMGVASPYLLMFTGVGLMVTPVRYLAITTALVVHVLLLVFLFPSEKNQNYALWFSNFSMLVVTLLLFSGRTKQRYFSPTFLFKQVMFYLIVPFFVILPFFNLDNRYPDYLSFNFKSGKDKADVIVIQRTVYDNLPENLHQYCHFISSMDMTFDYKKLCLDELNTDCISSPEVKQNVRNYLANHR